MCFRNPLFLISINHLSSFLAYAEIIMMKEDVMELNNKIGDLAIQDVLNICPEIGGILGRF